MFLIFISEAQSNLSKISANMLQRNIFDKISKRELHEVQRMVPKGH